MDRAGVGDRDGRVIAVAGSMATGTACDLITAVLDGRGGVRRHEPGRGPTDDRCRKPFSPSPDHRHTVLDLAEIDSTRIGPLVEAMQPDRVVVLNALERPLDPPSSGEDVVVGYAELLGALPADGLAVLNWDDQLVRGLAEGAPAPVRFFGLGPGAGVRGSDIAGRGLNGTELAVHTAEGSIRVTLPLIGLQSVHAALAATSVGLADGMELAEVGEALARTSSSVRVKLAGGINGSQILDDTYDAGPESMLAALNLLEELDGRKVAVLGQMLGLGEIEASAHARVGGRAADVVDLLVTVGPRATITAAEARRAGLAESAVVEAADHASAVAELRRRLRPGDTVLVKGSRETEMERVIRAIGVEG